MRTTYTTEFKLAVIKDYYTNDLGVRLTAKKWALPSKNYIEKWEQSLRKKNLIPSDWVKKQPLRAQRPINPLMEDSSQILALMNENERLRCELECLREAEKIYNIKKKTNTKL